MRMKSKIEPFVHLNTNPCKMCMPMGAVTAFYGLQKCITILHGSQGCSTYIRRHMATHYNEPVDVASSSLTEQGTVYGGEENLLKGLKNVIDLYEPEVIGVATTCLAETIGEDIKRIVEKFYVAHPEHSNITILPVHTAGYGGTQFNGYFDTLTQIVSQVKMSTKKHEKVNVVTGMISPADTRYLKRIFSLFNIEVIFLTDISTNLDAGFSKNYNRLPSGGTSIEEIKEMAGSRMTIEFCSIPLAASPGKYLEAHYGVPCKVLNLPMGLRDTDTFYQLLAEISQSPIPEELTAMRNRYLDAMVDSHKYNSGGRAIIYGDPDFVLGAVRLCTENGIMPMVVATGSICTQLKELVEEELTDLANRYFIDEFQVVDDIDFKRIEALALKYKVNLLIGHSDGRRIEEEHHIPLVRRGFPIHDRVGGQRLRTLGYEGSLTVLDELSNALLATTETSFRKNLFNAYYKEENATKLEEIKEDIQAKKEPIQNDDRLEVKNMLSKEVMIEKTKTHPCYNCGAHDYARIHLPIAPKCNIQCNYCVRKFDCPNESRPGVTTSILTPEEAFERFKYVKEKLPNLSVVGVAGPGDALANFEETKKTLQLIRAYDPEITFCLSTNGLMLPLYAQELVDLGVSHVTVTVNAVDPKIGAKIYKYVDYMGMHFIGEAAAAILLTNQLNGIKLLTSKGVICKVNIVTLKGINDEHIDQVVDKMRELECYMTNIMQLIPVKGSAFEDLPMASQVEINKIRKRCGESMKQMYHCKQCRADAIGILGEDLSIELASCKGKCTSKEEDQRLYRFAVASKNGMIVDQHFGYVEEFYIYDYQGEEAKYIEKRKVNKYCRGKEACDDQADKITRIIDSIEDCQGVITLRIGESPKRRLKEKGIKVFSTYDRIPDAIKKAAAQI